jgi:hypothetical protein
MSTKLFDMEKQLKRFLSSAAHSELLKETNGISGMSIIEAHIQKRWLDTDISAGTALLDEFGNGKTNCLNIINVGVAEKNRRKGLFKDFLELLEGFDYSVCFDKYPYFYIRIDNVMNPILDEFLPKKGYTRAKPENEPHFSYHKMVKKIYVAGNEYADHSITDYVFT